MCICMPLLWELIGTLLEFTAHPGVVNLAAAPLAAESSWLFGFPALCWLQQAGRRPSRRREDFLMCFVVVVWDSHVEKYSDTRYCWCGETNATLRCVTLSLLKFVTLPGFLDLEFYNLGSDLCCHRNNNRNTWYHFAQELQFKEQIRSRKPKTLEKKILKHANSL